MKKSRRRPDTQNMMQSCYIGNNHSSVSTMTALLPQGFASKPLGYLGVLLSFLWVSNTANRNGLKKRQ